MTATTPRNAYKEILKTVGHGRLVYYRERADDPEFWTIHWADVDVRSSLEAARHGIVQRTLQQKTHNAGITRESVRLKHTQQFTRHPDSATKHLTDTSDSFRNRPLISQTQPNRQTASNSQGIRWNRQIHELIRLDP